MVFVVVHDLKGVHKNGLVEGCVANKFVDKDIAVAVHVNLLFQHELANQCRSVSTVGILTLVASVGLRSEEEWTTKLIAERAQLQVQV